MGGAIVLSPWRASEPRLFEIDDGQRCCFVIHAAEHLAGGVQLDEIFDLMVKTLLRAREAWRVGRRAEAECCEQVQVAENGSRRRCVNVRRGGPGAPRMWRASSRRR